METVHDCHLCSHFTLSNLKSTEMKDIVLHAKFIWTNPNALREYWTYEGYYALKSGYSLLACVYWFPNWSEKSSNICNGTCMLEKIISFDQNARKENWFNQDTFNCNFYTLMFSLAQPDSSQICCSKHRSLIDYRTVKVWTIKFAINGKSFQMMKEKYFLDLDK